MPFLDNLHFITHGGALSISVALVLLTMSLLSWSIVIMKVLRLHLLKRHSQQFVTHFWQAPSLNAKYDADRSASPFACLVNDAHSAAAHYARYASQRTYAGRNMDEFVAHVLRRTLNQAALQLESGLTALATVGSLSPFIGLFGTVWGIYQALGAIALQSQTRVDQIAGPVGESLIMTAFGLVVAIPAVMAYNTLVRYNRLWLGELETFAHDLHTYITTGVPLPRELTANAISEHSVRKAAVYP